MLWLVPAMDRLWIEGADGRRRFLDRMTLSFVPDHAEVSLGYDKAMRERNRLLKDMVTRCRLVSARWKRRWPRPAPRSCANRARRAGPDRRRDRRAPRPPFPPPT